MSLQVCVLQQQLVSVTSPLVQYLSPGSCSCILAQYLCRVSALHDSHYRQQVQEARGIQPHKGRG